METQKAARPVAVQSAIERAREVRKRAKAIREEARETRERAHSTLENLRRQQQRPTTR